MNSSTLDIDPQQVRRLFARSMRGRADFILREIAGRMGERLDYIKLDATRVLDAGCGDGADLDRLGQRFERAHLIGLDLIAPEHGVSSWGSTWAWLRQMLGRRSTRDRIVGDFAALPLADASVDLIWSNLALHWHRAPHTLFPEWRRCLKVNGLVMFSVFGPDTLREVRAAFASADPGAPSCAHVAAFTDLHDYGDMLVAAGFATPVMDAERLTLTYSSADALWADVRALGGNPGLHRRVGLMGKAARQRLDAALDATRDSEGRYRLSFEVVYGHAWNPAPKTLADGRAIIRFDRQSSPRSQRGM